MGLERAAGQTGRQPIPGRLLDISVEPARFGANRNSLLEMPARQRETPNQANCA